MARDWLAFAGTVIGGFPVYKEAWENLLKRRMTMELSRVCSRRIVKVSKMKNFFSISNMKSVFGILAALGITALLPSLWAQENKTGSDSPQTAWASIQLLVKDMEVAVQSRNLHGIHDPTMKIRAPIKVLKQHSSMLSGDKGQKMGAALRQLDSSVTDLHSAADEGNHADSEKALKTVESALDELKAQDPESSFKNMH